MQRPGEIAERGRPAIKPAGIGEDGEAFAGKSAVLQRIFVAEGSAAKISRFLQNNLGGVVPK